MIYREAVCPASAENHLTCAQCNGNSSQKSRWGPASDRHVGHAAVPRPPGDLAHSGLGIGWGTRTQGGAPAGPGLPKVGPLGRRRRSGREPKIVSKITTGVSLGCAGTMGRALRGRLRQAGMPARRTETETGFVPAWMATENHHRDFSFAFQPHDSDEPRREPAKALNAS